MKKHFLAIGLAVTLSSGAFSQAHADDTPLCMQIWALPICLPLYTSVLLTGLTRTIGSKEVYVQALRDDAADYLANPGPMSALLEDAVKEVRNQDPTANEMSDEKVVMGILGNL